MVRWGKIVGLVHRVFLLGCPLGWLFLVSAGGSIGGSEFNINDASQLSV